MTAEAQTTAETTVLDSRPAAETFLKRVCFKLGPPTLVGAELEWFTALPDGSRPSLDLIAGALKDHSPRSLTHGSPALALRSGNIVSVEPGGQLELSSAPDVSAEAVVDALARDHLDLVDLLAAASISLVAGGADERRDPERLLTLPRYCAMEGRFDRFGPFGKAMMCNTAAVQVSLDAGADAEQVGSRWATLHAVGPALLAAFATTPSLRGVPEEDWASQRMRTWFELDRTRTRVPLGVDPRADYARWALDVPLLCIRRGDGVGDPPPDATFADWLSGALDDEIGRRPDTDDLRYHLTTLFPLVRASGHLEVRYLDGQPDGAWDVPVLAVAALLADDAVAEQARRVAAGHENRWEDAARDGLADPELRGLATALLDLAASTAVGPSRDRIATAVRRCALGLAPSSADAVSAESRKEYSR